MQGNRAGECRPADVRRQMTSDLLILYVFPPIKLIAKVAKSEASGDYLAV